MPRAAPVPKTYFKKTSLAHQRNSTQALNALLANNLQKRDIFSQQLKCVKVLRVKELPPVDENHHLIVDSFERFNSFDNTFDKLKNSSPINKQVSETNLNSNTCNKTDIKYVNDKQEDTLDKSVVNSLSIEKVSLHGKKYDEVTTLSSYSDDSNLLKRTSNNENQSLEQSFKPTFTRQSEDANKKVIIASTPALAKTSVEQGSLINELSPILSKPPSKLQIEKSYDEIHTWDFKPPKEFECSVGVTPKNEAKSRIHKQFRPRLKKSRKHKKTREKQLKIMGTFAKNYIFNDDKLNMEPRVVVDKSSIDILGISVSIKLGDSFKLSLQSEKSKHSLLTTSSSSNSGNVKNNIEKSPNNSVCSQKTPVQHLNSKKRAFSLTTGKLKLKKKNRLSTHKNKKSMSNNEITENYQPSEINEKIIASEGNDIQQVVERFGDIVTPIRKMKKFHKQLSFDKSLLQKNGDKNDLNISHTPLNHLMKTPELGEKDDISITSILRQKSSLLKKFNMRKKDNMNISNLAQEINGVDSDRNNRFIINLSSDFTNFKDGITNNFSRSPKKYVNSMYSLKDPNNFKSFITKHDLLRDCSTPKNMRKSYQKTPLKNVKNLEFSATEASITCENEIPFEQLLHDELQNNKTSDIDESLRLSTEPKRKIVSLTECSQQNLSQLENDYDNEMSVNSNEELLLRNEIYSSLSFSEASYLGKKLQRNSRCLKENLENSNISTREDILNDDESICSSVSAGEDENDELSSNYMECNMSLFDCLPFEEKCIFEEDTKLYDSQLNMNLGEVSLNKENTSQFSSSNNEDTSLGDVELLIKKATIFSTRKMNESEDEENESEDEENLSFVCTSKDKTYSSSSRKHTIDIEHSYSSNVLETRKNSSKLSLNENDFVDNSQIDTYSDNEGNSESENEVIVISDQEDTSKIFNDTFETSNMRKSQDVDVIEVFSSDEEAVPVNSSEESYSNLQNISDNNNLNSESRSWIKLDYSSYGEEDDVSYTSVDKSTVINNLVEKETTSSVFKTIEKPLVLKTGKSWRRSLLQIRKNTLCHSTTLNSIHETGGCCSSADCIQCKTRKHSRGNKLPKNIFVKSALSTIRQSINSTLLEWTLTADNTYGPNNTKDTVYQERTIVESFLDLTQNKSIYEESPNELAKSIVLRKCGQEKPLPFKECYPETTLAKCRKIGEGVYGEVFLYKNSEGSGTVMKIIPIEGNQLVNDEPQKKFSEILSEIVIAMELSSLRNNLKNNTSGFSEVKNVKCVQGKYPEKLLDLWDLYDEINKSENDSPEMFGDDQLYIILELSNGGMDMESFVFKNADEAYSLFKQISCTLAVSEQALEFEHRDLHWGNILMTRTDKNKMLKYCLNGREFFVPSNGIEVSIIDFTLSRIKIDNAIIYNDISKDPDLFSASGEYQFEVYKLMQQKNNNDWEHFEPYTNVLWMHYVIDKMITALRYASTATRTHKSAMLKLIQLEKNTLKYNSVDELVNNEFIS